MGSKSGKKDAGRALHFRNPDGGRSKPGKLAGKHLHSSPPHPPMFEQLTPEGWTVYAALLLSLLVRFLNRRRDRKKAGKPPAA